MKIIKPQLIVLIVIATTLVISYQNCAGMKGVRVADDGTISTEDLVSYQFWSPRASGLIDHKPDSTLGLPSTSVKSHVCTNNKLTIGISTVNINCQDYLDLVSLIGKRYSVTVSFFSSDSIVIDENHRITHLTLNGLNLGPTLQGRVPKKIQRLSLEKTMLSDLKVIWNEELVELNLAHNFLTSKTILSQVFPASLKFINLEGNSVDSSQVYSKLAQAYLDIRDNPVCADIQAHETCKHSTRQFVRQTTGNCAAGFEFTGYQYKNMAGHNNGHNWVVLEGTQVPVIQETNRGCIVYEPHVRNTACYYRGSFVGSGNVFFSPDFVYTTDRDVSAGASIQISDATVSLENGQYVCRQQGDYTTKTVRVASTQRSTTGQITGDSKFHRNGNLELYLLLNSDPLSPNFSRRSLFAHYSCNVGTGVFFISDLLPVGNNMPLFYTKALNECANSQSISLHMSETILINGITNVTIDVESKTLNTVDIGTTPPSGTISSSCNRVDDNLSTFSISTSHSNLPSGHSAKLFYKNAGSQIYRSASDCFTQSPNQLTAQLNSVRGHTAIYSVPNSECTQDSPTQNAWPLSSTEVICTEPNPTLASLQATECTVGAAPHLCQSQLTLTINQLTPTKKVAVSAYSYFGNLISKNVACYGSVGSFPFTVNWVSQPTIFSIYRASSCEEDPNPNNFITNVVVGNNYWSTCNPAAQATLSSTLPNNECIIPSGKSVCEPHPEIILNTNYIDSDESIFVRVDNNTTNFWSGVENVTNLRKTVPWLDAKAGGYRLAANLSCTPTPREISSLVIRARCSNGQPQVNGVCGSEGSSSTLPDTNCSANAQVNFTQLTSCTVPVGGRFCQTASGSPKIDIGISNLSGGDRAYVIVNNDINQKLVLPTGNTSIPNINLDWLSIGDVFNLSARVVCSGEQVNINNREVSSLRITPQCAPNSHAQNGYCVANSGGGSGGECSPSASVLINVPEQCVVPVGSRFCPAQSHSVAVSGLTGTDKAYVIVNNNLSQRLVPLTGNIVVSNIEIPWFAIGETYRFTAHVACNGGSASVNDRQVAMKTTVPRCAPGSSESNGFCVANP